jgi:translation initiation factor IF-3
LISGKQRKNEVLANKQIRAPRIRLVDEDGTALGIFSLEEALEKAKAKGLDLVEISPQSDPPVCRILNYGKFKYETRKKQAENRKKQKIVHLKELQLRVKIEEHDYQVKKNHAEKFLNHGDKVKVVIQFRGREMSRKELGDKLLSRFQEDLESLSKIDSPARLEGRRMIMILAPKETKGPGSAS